MAKALDNPLQVLKKSGIFKDLDGKTLADLAKNLKEEKHKAGSVILKMDTKADKVFFIQKGKVKISRTTRFGDETILNIVEEGNVVGELALVDGSHRSAMVSCLEDCELLVLPKKVFEKALQDDPALSQNLLKELTVRLRLANDNVVRKLENQRIESD